MGKLIHYIRGWARITACGPFPERLFNLCAQRRLVFWGVKWLDGQTVSMTLHRSDLPLLQELAGRCGCDVQVDTQQGLPVFAGRFRQRYAFLLGLALSAAAVFFFSGFILTIDVTGNRSVPDAVILSQLRGLGLRPGVYGPGLDTKQIAVELQAALDGLSWATVNLYGTRAQVVVREAVPPPAILEETGLSDITAREGGLITHVDVLEGQARVQEGDMAAPGEVLISGTVELEGPQYSDLPTRYLYVRAAGNVWARTWRTLSAAIPLSAETKEYTGEELSRWSLTVFDRRINFYGSGSISWACYDKISTTRCALLPGGQRLPLVWTRETFRRWQPVRVEVDLQAAGQLLQQQLLRRLERLVGEDGRVSRVSWSERVEEGVLIVTAQAECEEQIGRAGPVREVPQEQQPAAS